MRSYIAIQTLRERLGLKAPDRVYPANPPYVKHVHFPDSAWRTESAIREAVDGLLYPARWRVLWLPAEPSSPIPRTFYLRGTHAEVTARARAFFAFGTVVVEPAPHFGGESFDRRLNIIRGKL